MNVNGHSFLGKVYNIVKEESCGDTPLIRFEHPKDLEKILDIDISEATDERNLERCVRQVLQYSVKTNKPTFRNQLFGAMDPYGLSAAWILEAFNTSQYTYEVAPAFTLVEMKVLSHVLKVFGIPDGDGIFSPGGSMSMLYAIVAARFRAFPEVKSKGMRGLPELVLFTSEDSHYSIKKAAHWLGFGTESVRVIKTNAKGQMIVEELELAVLKDKEAGKYPLLVNATAGTTVLGAIDPLQKTADVCKKYGIWMHVDACWGGSLILSQKHKSKLNGIERAHSISWNPHKMAGAPLQCSVFLVREKGLLHEANSAAAQYLFQQDKFYDVSYDTGDKSIQCGRKIDAFKLWMMWKARGDAGLNQLADHTMELAQFCLNTVAKRPGFRLVCDDLQCPNVCFWYIPTRFRGEREDGEWWDRMHRITCLIKECLTKKSLLMVAYSPLRGHKNFFRLALTFHPVMQETHILEMLASIEECGEKVSVGSI
ncbi:cysteine sulfinic acid decarboxylase-like [Choristoneura fumiferana]|uniref:cysteine sulfinic acid decarboxylase-like n=1 Tax=Choristoneura fumiferana TaxID=7141 RepID=UPI003D15B80B